MTYAQPYLYCKHIARKAGLYVPIYVGLGRCQNGSMSRLFPSPLLNGAFNCRTVAIVGYCRAFAPELAARESAALTKVHNPANSNPLCTVRWLGRGTTRSVVFFQSHKRRALHCGFRKSIP